jgi:hypothetical protein
VHLFERRDPADRALVGLAGPLMVDDMRIVRFQEDRGSQYGFTTGA